MCVHLYINLKSIMVTVLPLTLPSFVVKCLIMLVRLLCHLIDKEAEIMSVLLRLSHHSFLFHLFHVSLVITRDISIDHKSNKIILLFVPQSLTLCTD